MTTLYNRVAVSTATTGTGTLTLGASLNNQWCTFAEAGVPNGGVVTYILIEGNDFELGRGTYTSSGTTLSRDTVLKSKITGTAGTAKMNLAGDAQVALTAAAEDFPSAQEEGSFTPTFTFATPGDLSVSYTAQTGKYVRSGSIVLVNARIECTPTYTTASGAARFGGLPFTVRNASFYQAALAIGYVSNLTFTGFLSARAEIGTTHFSLYRSASGAAAAVLQPSNIPSGTAIVVQVGGTYVI